MPLTFDELNQLIQQHENATTEFKAEPSDQVIQGISTDIAALANAQGGRIIFGVTNEGDPRGCELQGMERDRISQEASNCRPPIGIDFEEILFGKRHFLLVKIPRSSIVHSDTQQKFPVRIGNITQYLDAVGLISLIQERGLVKRELVSQAGPESERKRAKLPDLELTLIIKALSGKDPAIRIEALRDLQVWAHWRAVLESPQIVASIKKTLEEGLEDETKLVIDILRSAVLEGTKLEREHATSLMGLLASIAISAPSGEIATGAWQVLQYAKEHSAIDVLVRWVTETDDTRYAALRPANLVANAGYYGLRAPLRVAFFSILEKAGDDNMKKRVTEILAALRQGPME